MIEKSHAAHQEIQATGNLARDNIYWPQMNKQLVEACSTCNEFANSQQSYFQVTYLNIMVNTTL